MRGFLTLPVPVQNLACFWALLLCLGGIANAVLLWRQKRRLLCAAGAICFFVGYFFLHVCRAGTEWRLNGADEPLAMALLRLPGGVFLAALLMTTAVCVLLYRSVIAWRKTHITSASIKESVDGLPAGVCYYLEDGRCIFSNHRMNDLCFSLLGQTLQNGKALYALAKDEPIHAMPDGTAVSFRHRLLTYEGAPLHELIADDITELYEKTEQLRDDNERSRRLAEDMRAYGETISDTVRQQEILQAKINIHDEMNRMILATGRAIQSGSDAERRETLKIWQNQALLLCKEADRREKSSTVSDLNALAAVIGLRLIWKGMPQSREIAVLTLFLAAAREAMTNAAKHAKAETLTIAVSEDAAALRAQFTNDGAPPAPEIAESGGLAVLRRRLEAAGGSMRIERAPGFCLAVSIPKGGKNHALSGFDRGRPGDAPAAL